MDLFLTGLFWLFCAAALVSGAVVISTRKPVNSLFALIINSASLAGIYMVLGDFFMAAIQVIVYSGAILVLFLFVVMLLDIRRDTVEASGGRVRRTALGVLLGSLALLLGLGFWHGLRVLPGGDLPAEGWGDLDPLADLLFGPYILVFEGVSVLLISAMVGVVVLTKKHYVPAEALESGDGSPEEPPAGEGPAAPAPEAAP